MVSSPFEPLRRGPASSTFIFFCSIGGNMASPRHTTAPGTSVRAAWVRTSMPLGAVPLFHHLQGRYQLWPSEVWLSCFTKFGQTEFGQHQLWPNQVWPASGFGAAGVSRNSPRAQTCTFECPGPQKHHQISTEKTPQRGKKE